MLKLTWDRFLILLILLLAILLQSYCLLGHDMSWLMHAAGRLLHGGTYTHDFFETNPPMALYLHIPPFLLSALTHLNLITAFRLYVFLIAIISLLLCRRVLAPQFRAEHQTLCAIFMVCLAVCYFILPGREFGQREHLAVMLIMPFLLLQASNNNEALSYRVLIGLLAGIGFSIKPHFMFALVFVQIYLSVEERNYKKIFRIETMLIGSVCCAYVLSVFIFAPEYFDVIPYAQKFFNIYLTSSLAWSLIFSEDIIWFLFVTLLLFAVFKNNLAYRKLSIILCLAAIGFLFTYLAEPLYLWYHLIPLIAFSMLLFTLLFFDYTLIYAKSIVSKPIYLLIILLTFYFPLTYLFSVCVIMFLNSSFIEKQLIQVVKDHTQPGQKIFFMSMNAYAYPLIDYAQVKSSFRFEHLWPMVTVFHHATLSNNKKPIEITQQENFIKQAIISDFVAGDPVLVLIDPYVDWILYQNNHFDYLNFLSDSAIFQQQWKNYVYLTNVGSIKIYRHIKGCPKV